MAQRVVTERGGRQGLWVSKPGANAATATQANLLFNSDYSAMGFHRQGTFNVGWRSGQGWNDQSISFGKTFPSRPFVLFERVVGASLVRIGDLSGLSYYYTQDIEDIDGEYIGHREAYLIIATTTSAITVRSYWFSERGSDGAPPSIQLRYSIYDYNL